MSQPHTVDLLHFSAKLADHAQHYIGWCVDLDARLRDHATGTSACITRACVEREIPIAVVRTWPGSWPLERRLKRMKCGPKLCPLCNPNHWQRTGRIAG